MWLDSIDSHVHIASKQSPGAKYIKKLLVNRAISLQILKIGEEFQHYTQGFSTEKVMQLIDFVYLYSHRCTEHKKVAVIM